MKTIKGIWRFSRVICYTFVCLFQAYTRFKHVDRKEKGGCFAIIRLRC